MAQNKTAMHGIYVILGMGAITALLIVGSGHVSIPYSIGKPFGDGFPHNKGMYSYAPYMHSQQPYGPSLLIQEAFNICASNVGAKDKIKIDAKGGATVIIKCLIMQTQEAGHAGSVLIQDAVNSCVSNIDGKATIKPKGNKIDISARGGAVVKVTCSIIQEQSVATSASFMSQKAFNICASNIGEKNSIKIDAKGGSAIIIQCEILQVQTSGAGPIDDPIQNAFNICASNGGTKNSIKIDAKGGSYVVISCSNVQTQTMDVDPLLIQQASNICASNIGEKNSIKIDAKGGSAILIQCENNQIQTVTFA